MSSDKYWENKYSYIKLHFDLAQMHLDEILSDIADQEKRQIHAHKASFRNTLVDKAIKADQFDSPNHNE
jgi:hypothetical protein